MTDLPPTLTPEQATAERAQLLQNPEFVAKWNQSDPASIARISELDRLRVAGGDMEHRPRPPNAAGTGTLLSEQESIALAQRSIDAGGDVAAVVAALKADGIDFTPDTRPMAQRQFDDDFAVGRPERYGVGDIARLFDGENPQQIEALASSVRAFVAHVGLDRDGGTALAETMVKTMAEVRGMSPDARALWEQRQAAMLGEGDKRTALLADAAKSLAGMDKALVDLMNRSGALSDAGVIVQLAWMAQARAARATT